MDTPSIPEQVRDLISAEGRFMQIDPDHIAHIIELSDSLRGDTVEHLLNVVAAIKAERDSARAVMAGADAMVANANSARDVAEELVADASAQRDAAIARVTAAAADNAALNAKLVAAIAAGQTAEKQRDAAMDQVAKLITERDKLAAEIVALKLAPEPVESKPTEEPAVVEIAAVDGAVVTQPADAPAGPNPTP